MRDGGVFINDIAQHDHDKWKPWLNSIAAKIKPNILVQCFRETYTSDWQCSTCTGDIPQEKRKGKRN